MFFATTGYRPCCCWAAAWRRSRQKKAPGDGRGQHLRALDVSSQRFVGKRAKVTIAGEAVSHCVNVGVEENGTADRVFPMGTDALIFKAA
jgi:hypothetical protein